MFGRRRRVKGYGFRRALRADYGATEKYKINVYRQSYHLLEDQNGVAESRDRNQVNYFVETFSWMTDPVRSLLLSGSLAGSPTAAKFTKVALPAQTGRSFTSSDINQLNTIVDGNENNQLWIKFKKSMMYFTFANPQTYPVTFKVERWGWNRRYTVSSTDALDTRMKQYLGQVYTTAVPLTGVGTAAELQYPTDHKEPAVGAYQSAVTKDLWEGHTSRSRNFAAFCVKKLSSRKWKRLLPGQAVTYKIARGGISYPIKTDTPPERFDGYMAYCLRCIWKGDMGFQAANEELATRVLSLDPLLALKVTHNYRVVFTEFDVGGPVNLIVRGASMLNSIIAGDAVRQAQPVQAGNVTMENSF